MKNVLVIYYLNFRFSKLNTNFSQIWIQFIKYAANLESLPKKAHLKILISDIWIMRKMNWRFIILTWAVAIEIFKKI